jgi:hypothetical protein
MSNVQKNDTSNKHGINPIAVGITGAVIGAGFAVGGAVALRDKKNREKVKKVLGNAKDQAMNYLEDMRKTPDENVNKKLANKKKETKKLTKLTKLTNKPIKKAAKKLSN